MFYFSIFILDSSFSALASPSPSDTDPRHSFRPRARCRASNLHSFAGFNLDTGPLSHTTPRALSPAGLSLSASTLTFPPTLTLCVAYNVLLRTRNYKYPSPALLKTRQIGPVSPPSFVHVSGQPRPILVSCSLISLCSLAFLVVRSDFSHRYSPQSPANPCVSPPRYQFISRLDRRAVARLRQRE